MKTLAIIIGNNEYYEGHKLTNAVNDATKLAEVFGEFGYEVKLHININKHDLTEIMEFYRTNLEYYDASIFYFAGHGFEVEGENFLATIDSQIPPVNKYVAKQECILLDDLFEIYRQNPTQLNIVIVDACRKSFDRGNVLGFSPIKTPKGSIIAFSTSPNEGASDIGFENHSVYTGSLLKHIQAGRIGVEDLFKSVRKTVYALSQGRQTTWEHTSLIGDFFFHKVQELDILSLPYDNHVIKDENYFENSSFGKSIQKLKSYTWNEQNFGLGEIQLIPKGSLNENQQFILGRNILQSAVGGARSAENFFSFLSRSLLEYQTGEDNHVLNGILFEMYFDSKGEFRYNKCKGKFRAEIFALKNNPAFDRSFNFISDILSKQNYELLYKPTDLKLDIAIKATRKIISLENLPEQECQQIDAIVYNNVDITKEIFKHFIDPYNEDGLKIRIGEYLNAPLTSIFINSNLDLTNIRRIFW